MRERRRRLGGRARGTAVAAPPGGASPAPPPGIPLLLMPEGVMFDVDLSRLLGGAVFLDARPGDEDVVKGIGSALVQLFLRTWDF